MAISIADATGVENNNHVLGDLRVKFLQITCDDDYATGGYDVTAEDLGLNSVEFALVAAGVPDSNVVVTSGRYLPETEKLLLFDTDSEVANSGDIAGATVTVVAFGK